MLLKLLTTVMFSLGFSVAASAGQISDYKELNELFDFMDESMDETDVFFSYETDFSKTPCVPTVVSREDLIKNFVDVVDSTVGEQLLSENQESSDLKNLIEVELNQFLQLLGDEPYLSCQGSGSGFMTSSTYDYFGSKNFQIFFEFGYED